LIFKCFDKLQGEKEKLGETKIIQRKKGRKKKERKKERKRERKEERKKERKDITFF